MITGLDLRVHLAGDGVPLCGAGQGEIAPLLTLHGPAVTCAACLASRMFPVVVLVETAS